MRTNESTTTKHRVRDSLRAVWDDVTKANRAVFRLPPYDDYLKHGRYTH